MADKDEKHIDNFDEYLPDEAEVEAWLKSEEFDSDGGDEPVAAEPREADAHDPDTTHLGGWWKLKQSQPPSASPSGRKHLQQVEFNR